MRRPACSNSFGARRAGLETADRAPGWRPPEDALWLDLLSPTREEELAVEEALGLELPTREEMARDRALQPALPGRTARPS